MGEVTEKIYCCDRGDNDPDGYDGMIFCRWTADAIGKAIKLDWEKFV